MTKIIRVEDCRSCPCKKDAGGKYVCMHPVRGNYRIIKNLLLFLEDCPLHDVPDMKLPKGYGDFYNAYPDYNRNR